jgi:hypothetical protein
LILQNDYVRMRNGLSSVRTMTNSSNVVSFWVIKMAGNYRVAESLLAFKEELYHRVGIVRRTSQRPDISSEILINKINNTKLIQQI